MWLSILRLEFSVNYNYITEPKGLSYKKLKNHSLFPRQCKTDLVLDLTPMIAHSYTNTTEEFLILPKKPNHSKKEVSPPCKKKSHSHYIIQVFKPTW